jgi:radical SAM protein with 4Fe4S-binding SPASM domain
MDAWLKRSKNFCMAPWTHLSVQPDGEVYPCCAITTPLGSLHETTLRALWNSEALRAMRVNMLADAPVAACARCRAIEARGFDSMRTNFNRRGAHHFAKVSATEADGTFEPFNYVFFSVRFNNLCNMKCRMCNPGLSSRWSEDERDGPVLRRSNVSWSEIDDLLPIIEEVYFSGGEPLLQAEHYRLLEKLIAADRMPILRYSSNASRLNLKGHREVIALWQHFPQVFYNVSLDQIGAKAEYARHGIRWSVIADNLGRVREAARHVAVQPSLTVSLFNILDLPEIVAYLIERDFATEGVVYLHNILREPPHLSIQVLTADLKLAAARGLDRLLQDIEGRGLAAWAMQHYRKQIGYIRDYLWLAERAEQRPVLRAMMARYDGLRHEAFASVFPELASLVA